MIRRLRDWLGRKLLGIGREEVPTVADLQRRMVALELQWSETLDFIQHWASRQAKRDQRAAQRALKEEPQEAEIPVSQPLEGSRESVKAELRRRAAALRGIGGRIPLSVGGEP